MMQPTDTQAELLARARALWKEIVRANGNDAVVRVIAAALQSEREAAAAEARSAAIEECAKYAESRCHINSFHVAIGIRALASPTP